MMDEQAASGQWRFWPVFLMAFFYPIVNALLGLAIPLYYFRQGISTEIIGFLVAAYTITYAFSPTLLTRVSERFGRKRSIILSMFGVGLLQSTYFITLAPAWIFICRMGEGFFTGFFWANLQSSISDNAAHDHSKYTAVYNTSWNVGAMIGYLIGTIAVFLFQDLRIIFYLCPFVVGVNALIAILFFQQAERVDNKDSTPPQVLKSLEGLSKKELKAVSDEYKKDALTLARYRLTFMLPATIIVAFSVAKAGLGFIYPLKSELLGIDTYTVYLLSFFSFIPQLLTTTYGSMLSVKAIKRLPIVCLISLVVTIILFGFTTSYYVFIVLFLIYGFFSGFLYGIGLKLFIALNLKRKTSKYTGICESLIGASFLLIPIVSGFIATIDINLAFYLISVLLSLFAVMIVIFSNKLTKIE